MCNPTAITVQSIHNRSQELRSDEGYHSSSSHHLDCRGIRSRQIFCCSGQGYPRLDECPLFYIEMIPDVLHRRIEF